MNNKKTKEHQKSVEDTFVSVVMAVYNGEHFLQEAIESVLAQTHTNFEFIIIDDGSKDNTATILRNFASHDTRIRYYYQENAGTATALNVGDSLAKADIIARMDADDIMLPDRLEKQLSFLSEHPEAAAISCLAYYINNKGKVLGKSYSDLLSIEACKQVLATNGAITCLHPGAMFRKKALEQVKGYREIKVCHDFDLWNRLADAGCYTLVTPEILMKYRLHSHSLMSSYRERLLESDWVSHNIKLRRQMQEEISFAEFREVQKQYSPLRKLKDWQHHMANFYYRNSGLSFGEQSYFKFLLFLATALVLHPKYVFEKITRQFIALK